MKRKAATEHGPQAKQPAKLDAQPVASTSSMRMDETDFPRGGGTSLTQMEVKTAKREAIAELDRDEELFARDSKAKRSTDGTDEGKHKKRRRKEKDAAKAVKPDVAKQDTIRVEHLNYKRCTPGTKLLCLVVSVHALELIVSLPNELSGHIPLVNISSGLTAQLASGHPDDESESTDEQDEDDSPDLTQMYEPGQYLIASVVACRSSDVARNTLDPSRRGDEAYRTSRRLELSLDPKPINDDLARSDLTDGLLLPVSVKSVEDNGYVLDLRLKDEMTSFVKFEEAQTSRKLIGGQVITARLIKLASNGRTCTLAIDATRIRAAALATAPTLHGLLPGNQVNAIVSAVIPGRGLNVKFLGFFDGTIDHTHLVIGKEYKEGNKIKARLLWSSAPTLDAARTFALSALPHVLKLAPPLLGDTLLKEAVPIGTFVDSVKVNRTESEHGLACTARLGANECAAFVHISRVSDEHLGTLSAKSGPYCPGTTHRGRVIGLALLDGALQISLQPSVLAQRFLRVSDVVVGEAVKATIKRITSKAMFVSVDGNVDAVVWPLHYSDIKLKHPEKRFKIGDVVKGRIFAADSESSKIVVTLKKSLLASDLPVPQSLADVKPQQAYDAVLSKIMEKALLVDLFGGARAIIPISEAGQGFVDNLAALYKEGQRLQVRIMHVDTSAGRITASLRERDLDGVAALEGLKVGQKTEAVIAALHNDNIVLEIAPSKARGLLSYTAHARQLGVATDELKQRIAVGQLLKDLTVVSKNTQKGIAILSSGSTSTNSSANGISDMLQFESVAVGETYAGKIIGSAPQGLHVQLSRALRALAHWTDVLDDFDAALPAPGTVVSCNIVGKDEAARRVDVSLRPSVMADNAEGSILDPEIISIDELRIGQKIRGFVVNVADSGLFVSVGRSLTARVQIRELFDEYVREWKPRFSVGQLVSGSILKLDPERNQIELSLRSERTAAKSDANALASYQVGQIASCVIKTIERYGAFLRITDTLVSGLCHRSQFPEQGAGWSKGFKIGQSVQARIVEVDTKSKKIGFTLLDVAQEDPDISAILPSAVGEADESDDEDLVVDLGDPAPTAEHIGPNNGHEAVISDISSKPLALIGGFEWSTTQSAPTPALEVDSDEAESTVADDASEEETGSASDGDRNVTSLERELIGSPDSSILWIQYISLLLEARDITQAREVAQRALSTINYREDEERFNVWNAILSMENQYGTPETLETAFKEAVQANEAKRIHLRLAEILTASNKHAQAEELYQRTVKKFSQSSKVWTIFATYLHERRKSSDARELVARSMKSLPQRKHVKTAAKFAQVEFKHGDAERGRTMFEGIIDSYPKRLDLWLVYIDMEARSQNMAAVRFLFDRLLAQKLSTKKAKSVLKKWLSLEKLHGDDASVETVKERAREVAAKLVRAE
ncbi:uncharacterized protein L969DRAFT_42922 [Mixia osmundae IAM 14324]|uniref:S1 motif domain-containing protein n=1 Tax=Mixia osmundae (strain CBS 9802 / IAM 14324 / JCM 22182 / KY 12970) TaxID=764103 RepID=G7E4L3_MIXOS|nr:uncharacterized protein L969DRAFT_42922 [Mixia osmundae IAM 14324]KEI41847.1 hypothetical protein L969DRAFT_42922 [Mixia osmundae IAM 14324]GAA97773.1 hypothetical protein E5Q_04452 [Mixia osmundae IAM 14324]